MNKALDDLDLQIIVLLRTDGRRPNASIARELGVSEATVRSRLKRLQSQGFIQIVAIAHYDMLGLTKEFVYILRTTPQRTTEVAETLADMPEVRYVALVTGAYELIVNAAFATDQEAASFLLDRVFKLDGVVDCETCQVIKVYKRAYYQVHRAPPDMKLWEGSLN